MKKVKKITSKIVKVADRTFIGPVGTRTHAPVWKNEGVFTGRKFVKKANMTIEYTNFNTPKRSDSNKWI